MVRAPVIAAALLLFACSKSAAEKAQADADFLEHNGGSFEEICAAKTRVANAYRDEHDAAKWRAAQEAAKVDCSIVEMRRISNALERQLR